MGAKQRFKNQFRFSVDYLALRHENASDFYLSCWQSGQSAVPLLIVRLALLLVAAGTITYSLYLNVQSGFMAFWATYMTQWALVTLGITTAFATAVSIIAYVRGPIDSPFGLPWYLRVYWVLYSIALPIAFFVTIFYYSFLTDAAPDDYEIDPLLDVLIHGINSVIMFILMATSQQPLYFLQIIFPVCFILTYMTFSIIYYFAGGLNPFGEHTIYPMLDWADPGPAVGLVFMSLALLLGTTTVANLFTMLRDYLSRKWKTDNNYSL